MELRYFYTQKKTFIIRGIATLAILVFIISNIFRAIKFNDEFYTLSSNYQIFYFSIDCICILLCFALIVFPKKIELLTITFFLESIIAFFDYRNPLSVIMYILGYLTLLSKNFLHKNKKLKNGCFLLFYVLYH